MGETEESNFRTIVEEEAEEQTKLSSSKHKNKKWWAKMIIYTLFVLLGQSSATLLGRLYYNEGGNTILMAALLETVGFPILIPLVFYFSKFMSGNEKTTTDNYHSSSSPIIRASVYIILGLFQAASSVLYAIGLQNLPVSTFSLINTTQLGFNAVFSLVLNAQKFTFFILNALVLVTISSALLMFQNNTKNTSKNGHFVVGFSCTLVATALYSLILSMTQLAFHKVLERETFSTVLNVIMYQSLVASSCVVAVAMFTGRNWSDLRNEGENFELGKVMYVVILVMIAVAWQVYSIGTVGLIFEVSSLFSNVIDAVGLPVVPVLAAVFFHEKMDGIKVVSIVLAVWGFVSYVYQHYLDDCKDSENVEGLQQ